MNIREGSVITSQVIKLSGPARYRICWEVLNELKDGHWIKDGMVYHEEYTSHRFDVCDGPVTDLKWKLLVAIEDLLAEFDRLNIQ